MLKNISRLEHIVEGKVFHLFCDTDSSTNQGRHALDAFRKYIDDYEESVLKSRNEEKEEPQVEVLEQESPIEAS